MVEDIRTHIQQALKEDNVVVGFKETRAGVESGEIETVILAANCPPRLKEAFEASESDVTIEVAEQHNELLGSICRKPFAVSVVGIRK